MVLVSALYEPTFLHIKEAVKDVISLVILVLVLTIVIHAVSMIIGILLDIIASPCQGIISPIPLLLLHVQPTAVSASHPPTASSVISTSSSTMLSTSIHHNLPAFLVLMIVKPAMAMADAQVAILPTLES